MLRVACIALWCPCKHCVHHGDSTDCSGVAGVREWAEEDQHRKDLVPMFLFCVSIFFGGGCFFFLFV